MLSDNFEQLSEDYRRIEQAILFLEQNFKQQPDLKEVASSVGLSEYHFQRLFSRWAGISPKRFLQFLTIEHAKKLLEESNSLLDVTYETGLSSPGRLHDLFVTYEAITPGEFKKKGEGLAIQYGFHSSPFGECLLAVTERGICGLAFVQNDDRASALEELKSSWPQATFEEDSTATLPYIAQIFTSAVEEEKGPPLKLFLKGTNFQLKVWQALLQIPLGSLASYNTIANRMGQPGAARAIGTATAHNPIGFIIPCHRVIRKLGLMGDYHWGAARKKAILGWETAQRYALTASADLPVPQEAIA